ncbi:hypothetical protein THSYN_21335 [Candidatus Thiodictyon syntrophicum]|uniref:Uncharacterized protein n=2 Tax=Candidatus Thiodictyon syntrophicum TaxID=1166950 RepID=A0A2K8UCD0_9GAMM|nr:hypothetical protein THSYN_21335 [Candidatus Thiodictyon syntrophicum]
MKPQRFFIMKEVVDETKTPARRKFADGGQSQEMADFIAAVEQRRRDGPPPTPAELDRYERMQVEAGGPIPERFKHLQYINKARGRG